MKVFIVFAALIAVAVAQVSEPIVPIPYSYNYNAETEDGGSSSRQESSDGAGRVSGSYTVNNIEGHSRVVEYIADENGFRAVVKSNEPGTTNQNPADVTVESSADATAPVLNRAVIPAPKPVVPETKPGVRYVLVPITDPRASVNKTRRNAALKGVELKKTLSGFQKRKIRKEKVYNINSKYAKLDNFLISASLSSCASASSSNARELDEQILEVKINPQEKNTVSDTSTSTPIDADLREHILKLGSYQPEGNIQNDAKGRSFSSYYSFISKTRQKIERKWLCYSTRLHVAYCQVCWLFADRTNMYLKEAWRKGVNDWQGISKKN
ncbi:cuticle protein 10.9 [Trichonephila clavipes]|nr:cuticle protein 10.9 [Trichonephila clavipes]